MFVVRENRNVRQTFCPSCSFSAIFMLCISVCVIFVATSEKDTIFNIKYDKDKSAHHLDDDIIETVSIINNLSKKEDVNTDSSKPHVNIFYTVIGITTIAIMVWWMYKCCQDIFRDRPVVPIDNDGARWNIFEPIVQFDGERARINYNNDPNIVQPDRVEPVIHFDGERVRMDCNNDPNIVQPDRVEPVVPIDNDGVRRNIFGAAEAV